MGNEKNASLLQGTLDMLILKALTRGTMHGYAITEFIHSASEDALRVEEGALYPALHRLEVRGWLASVELRRSTRDGGVTMDGRWLAVLRHRVLTLFRRRQLEEDLEDELAFHLAMKAGNTVPSLPPATTTVLPGHAGKHVL